MTSHLQTAVQLGNGHEPARAATTLGSAMGVARAEEWDEVVGERCRAALAVATLEGERAKLEADIEERRANEEQWRRQWQVWRRRGER